MTEPAKVSRTVYLFECLHPTASPPTDLREALERSDDDDMVGMEKHLGTAQIPRPLVGDALAEMGSDDALFEYLFEDDDD